MSLDSFDSIRSQLNHIALRACIITRVPAFPESGGFIAVQGARGGGGAQMS